MSGTVDFAYKLTIASHFYDLCYYEHRSYNYENANSLLCSWQINHTLFSTRSVLKYAKKAFAAGAPDPAGVAYEAPIDSLVGSGGDAFSLTTPQYNSSATKQVKPSFSQFC